MNLAHLEPSVTTQMPPPGPAPRPPAPLAPQPAPSLRFAYSFGRIEPRCPQISIDKEIAQAIGALADEIPEGEKMRRVLVDPSNQYLVRKLCWVFSVRGQDAFVVTPADPMDWKLLPETLGRDASGWVDVVIGHLAPPAGACAALGLPLVHFDRLHSFSRAQLLEQLHELRGARKLPTEHFNQAFDQLITLAEDNLGTADADRALNYLVLRYPDIYRLVAEQLTAGRALESVRARPSPLGVPRRILDVVLSFLDGRDGGYSRHYVRVDITEEFPFLVSGAGPYVEH